MKNIVFENVKKAYGKNVVVEDLRMGTALAALLQQSRFLQAGPLSLCGASNNKSLMKADAVHNNL